MKVLVDSNVVMDALAGRDPFFDASNRVLEICAEKKVAGILAAHTVTNLFYLLRKRFSNEECREMLLGLFDIFRIEQVDETNLRSALLNGRFTDFEDCLQMECGVAGQAEYIITRDKAGFARSVIPWLTPMEFCEMMAAR